MDEIRNPFDPGAGSQPPELAGRSAIINDMDVALQPALRGRHAKSQMLLGLRGAGKTVLLNPFEQLATSHGFQSSFIQAPDDSSLAELLYPQMHQVLRKLSMVKSAKEAAFGAMRGLRSFASAFKIEVGDVSIAVDPAAGVADSGSLEQDLTEMSVLIGKAAQSAGTQNPTPRGYSIFLLLVRLTTMPRASQYASLSKMKMSPLTAMPWTEF